MIDVHAHHFFYKNFNEVIEENKRKGVKIIIESGIDPKTNRKVIENSKIDIVYFSLGFHPTDIVKFNEEEIRKEIEFIENFDHNKFLAIGEIGLDFYWVKDKDLIKKQIFWFSEFLSLAERKKKPVVIHSREAEKEVIEILKSYNVKVILHSFWKPKLVKEVIDNNFFISIPAFVYKDKGLQKIVKETPVDLILTETDTPFLDPIEKRNNKSWKIEYGIKKIAEIKNIDIEEIKKNIIKNFEKIFNINDDSHAI